MSHGKERKEKDCLNCGTIVEGRYCQHCGQENIEPRETFWGMVTHFFNDITHFDGKFLPTVSYLITRPGFLSTEYVRGRRQRYLHPIRMYVFSSALFFFLFFAFVFKGFKINMGEGDGVFTPLQYVHNQQLLQAYEDIENDSISEFKVDSLIRAEQQFQKDLDSLKKTGNHIVWQQKTDSFNLVETAAIAAADSLETSGDVKAYSSVGFLNERLKVWNAAGRNKSGALNAFLESLLHKLPYVLMVTLPFFALVLKFLYVRNRNLLYFNHAVFSIHYFIFMFIMFGFTMLFYKLHVSYHLGIFQLLKYFTIFMVVFYLLFAMKNFYSQGWSKTIFKYFLLVWFNFFVAFFVALFFSLAEAFIFDFGGSTGAASGGH